MKKIIFVLLVPFVLIGCTPTITYPGSSQGTGFKNSIYSSGREITWKGNKRVVRVHDGGYRHYK